MSPERFLELRRDGDSVGGREMRENRSEDIELVSPPSWRPRLFPLLSLPARRRDRILCCH